MKMLEERKEIISVSNRLYKAGLVSEGQGNISVFNRQVGLIAITPSAVPYSQRETRDICLVDLEGNLIEGKWKPTSEISLHLIQYQKRADVNAVIHSHAPKATVFGIIGSKPMPMVLTEAAMKLGRAVPIAPYARPGTVELGEITQLALGDGNAAIMANHGIITVGTTLEGAYQATIAVETTAETLINASALGHEIKALDALEVIELSQLHGKYKPQKRNQN